MDTDIPHTGPMELAVDEIPCPNFWHSLLSSFWVMLKREYLGIILEFLSSLEDLELVAWRAFLSFASPLETFWSQIVRASVFDVWLKPGSSSYIFTTPVMRS